MKKGMYKHFKGNIYEVIDIAKHSETLKDFVVYKNNKGELWIRDKEMFLETITRDNKTFKRFEYINK